jgi:hypothetical protein
MFQKVKGQSSKNPKNYEKRRFTRSKVKVQKIKKMMRKDVSGGQRSKFKKSISCWMLWKMKKIKEIMQCFECFLLNAMKNEENARK